MLTDTRKTQTAPDVSDRSAADESFRRACERLEPALDAAGVVLWEWDPLMDELRHSRGLEHVLGSAPDAPVRTGRDFLALVHAGDRDRVAQALERAVQQGEEYRERFRLARPDGAVVRVEDRGRVVRGEDGRPLCVSGVLSRLDRPSPDASSDESLREGEGDRDARRRAAELEVLLDTVPAAVWVAHDAECCRVTVNRQAIELFRLVGRLATGDEDDAARCAGTFAIKREGRRLRPHELALQRAAASGVDLRDELYDIEFDDGTVRHVFGNAVPLLDDEGRPRGALAAFVDVTELHRAQQSLREADRRKDQFLAVLGHELRNPLSTLVNGVHLLPRLVTGLDERAAGLCNQMERQARHMTRLVDDLLDVSRIGSGKIALDIERLNLCDAIRRALEDLRPQIDESGCELAIELPAEPLWIEGDPTRIAQVIGNLLHNACKFTPAGGRVSISARVEADADGTPQATVTVCDTGLGMSGETVANLFEMFRQAESARARGGGLGLGLALVRGLVELHGGWVAARSDGEGCGSEFVVRLPLAAGTAATAPAAVPVAPASPAPAPPLATADRRFRVLLVEDSRPVAEIFSLMLSDLGHEVHVVSSGLEALEVLPRWRPEVVLSDISMPGMNGYELAREIRGQPEWQDLTLVAMTGFAQPDERQQALEAGFNEHLVKPADVDRLQALFATLAR